MVGIEPAVIGVTQRAERADVDHGAKVGAVRGSAKCQACDLADLLQAGGVSGSFLRVMLR